MVSRILVILSFVFITTGIHAQTKTPPVVAHDTLYKLNGQIILVDVTTVTPAYVSFVYPGKPDEYTIERKEIHKIVYKTGKIEVLNQAAFELLDESSWEAVWVTEDKSEVGDLYMLGEIEARSPSSARSATAAKKGALIKLQKKAANMKGTVILVTKKETSGGYGEYPGYYIKGIAYGPEPPSQEPPSDSKGVSVKDAGL